MAVALPLGPPLLPLIIIVFISSNKYTELAYYTHVGILRKNTIFNESRF